ncbi:GNAT family N-acetyltransferase [Candidatus Bipolaricaulota bacterium]
MSESIEVRRLGPEDADLARETIRAIKTGEESSDAPSLPLATLQTWLSRASNILITATHDSLPVGFALGYLLDRVDQVRPMLFFYEIEVVATYRRKGIGSRLVEALKSVARERDALKMWVQTDPGSIAARALYRHTGGVECGNPDLLYVWTYRDNGAPESPPRSDDPPKG